VEDEKAEGTTYFTVEDRSTQGMMDECYCLLLGRKRAGAEAAWARHCVTYVIHLLQILRMIAGFFDSGFLRQVKKKFFLT
jgi:hypothetical protein